MTKILAVLNLQDVLDHALTKKGPYFYTDTDSASVSRLKQFAVHGCECHFCGIEGDRVLVTQDSGGIHVDVYAGNKMMNRDHIKPVSLRGRNDVWNLRPTCLSCNSRRGNNYTKEDEDHYKFNRKWAEWHNRIWCKKLFTKDGERKNGLVMHWVKSSINRLAHFIPEKRQYDISNIVTKWTT